MLLALQPIDEFIADSIASFGYGDLLQYIIMILAMFVISLILFTLKAPALPILFVNVILLILFTILGWVAYWVILVLAVALFLFTIIKLIRRDN